MIRINSCQAFICNRWFFRIFRYCCFILCANYSPVLGFGSVRKEYLTRVYPLWHSTITIEKKRLSFVADLKCMLEKGKDDVYFIYFIQHYKMYSVNHYTRYVFDDAKLSRQELHRVVRLRIIRFSSPRKVDFCTEVPMTDLTSGEDSRVRRAVRCARNCSNRTFIHVRKEINLKINFILM